MNLLVRFALFLDSCDDYKKLKSSVKDVFDNPKSKYRLYFDFFMIFLIISSIAIVILSVKYEITSTLHLVELFILSIFTVEYLIRFWIHNDIRAIIIELHKEANFLNIQFNTKLALKKIILNKFEYIISPLAIIDLLAILSAFAQLRFLRLFLIFRMFKIFRYTKSMNEFGTILLEKRFEFFTLLVLIAFMMFTSASIIYVAEANDPASKINTFFDALYWALITVSTVGYGDIVPISVQGKIATGMLIITGLGIIAFATSIIATAFTEKMLHLKTSKILLKTDKLESCTIICGYGKIGQIIAKRLQEADENFIIIDNDHSKVELATSKNMLAIEADATKTETLIKVGIKNKNMTNIICLTDSEVQNIYIVLGARALNNNIKIISRINNIESKQKFILAGVNEVVYPFENSAQMATEYVSQPIAFDAIDAILFGKENAFIEEVAVIEGSLLDNKKIGEIDFRKYKLIPFGVLRHHEKQSEGLNYLNLKSKKFIFNPSKDFILQSGDILVVMGFMISINHFRNIVKRAIY
ncbi:MAG: NAD-binding protein [Campylobacterales bacterium]|nr:NAD-binding protein [Campylobacterales bacterium]